MDPVEEDELKDLLEDLKTETFAQNTESNFEGTELGKRPRKQSDDLDGECFWQTCSKKNLVFKSIYGKNSLTEVNYRVI